MILISELITIGLVLMKEEPVLDKGSTLEASMAKRYPPRICLTCSSAGGWVPVCVVAFMEGLDQESVFGTLTWAVNLADDDAMVMKSR